MAELRAPFLRQIFRFGAGVGLVAGETDLEVAVVRVRPGGARLLAALRIHDFRERPAAEWGAEYGEFLQKHSAGHLAALVVLPRHEVIVRQVRLPGVADEDASSAIRFQLDALHPFREDEVVSDFRRAGRSDAFVVAIAERRHIDFYTALFAEAGIKLAGFTFSGGAVFPSVRLFAEPPSTGLLAVDGLHAGAEAPVEIYGESSSHPLFSAQFDVPAERAASLAAAEMRLEPGVETRDLAEVLPAWQSAPEDLDFSDAGKSRIALVWATGLAAACPRLGSPVNLLPAEFRTVSSRAVYVPTIVLSVILALLATGLIVQRSVMDSRYTALLRAEVSKLAPVARQVETLDSRINESSRRIQQLEEFRRRTKGHLDIVLELTQTLAPPAYISALQIDQKSVTIAGEIEQADTLLKKLDASPRFAGSEFTMPLARSATGELFRIRTNREGAAR